MADGLVGTNIFTILQQGVQSLNAIYKTLTTAFPQVAGTATTATSGSASLPATPAGFISVTMPDGTTKKVPYYND